MSLRFLAINFIVFNFPQPLAKPVRNTHFSLATSWQTVANWSLNLCDLHFSRPKRSYCTCFCQGNVVNIKCEWNQSRLEKQRCKLPDIYFMYAVSRFCILGILDTVDQLSVYFKFSQTGQDSTNQFRYKREVTVIIKKKKKTIIKKEDIFIFNFTEELCHCMIRKLSGCIIPASYALFCDFSFSFFFLSLTTSYIISAYWVNTSGKIPDNIQPTTNHFIFVSLLHNDMNHGEIFFFLFKKRWFWSWLCADNFTQRGLYTENDVAL